MPIKIVYNSNFFYNLNIQCSTGYLYCGYWQHSHEPKLKLDTPALLEEILIPNNEDKSWIVSDEDIIWFPAKFSDGNIIQIKPYNWSIDENKANSKNYHDEVWLQLHHHGLVNGLDHSRFIKALAAKKTFLEAKKVYENTLMELEFEKYHELNVDSVVFKYPTIPVHFTY